MQNKPTFMIIGGDCRFSYIRTFLESKGYAVRQIYPGDYKADNFRETDIFILPVPVTRDNININTPLAGEYFYIGDFLRLIPENSLVAGGLFSDELKEKILKKNVKIFDYYTDEELAEANAIPTAEGVIGILINAVPMTINCLACAVTGYGKCGKATAKALKSLGAEVTVFARREESIKEAEDDGMKAEFFCKMPSLAKDFSCIINTVPARVIDNEIITNLSKDCLLIEIASAPFGINFDSAKEHGINTIKAGSLPGRISPKTAGEIICRTILSYIGSDNNEH